MNTRSTSLLLPLSEKEKDFVISKAKESNLSISDFVLLCILSLNKYNNDSYLESYKESITKVELNNKNNNPN